MKPTPPKIVADWQKMIETPPPRCCHTCWHYTDAGVCKVFHAEPPEYFTQEIDQCDDWEQDVPF